MGGSNDLGCRPPEGKTTLVEREKLVEVSKRMTVAYGENFHEGGFCSRSYGGHLCFVCAFCDVTI